LWNVLRECCYGESMSKADSISMMKSAMTECSALYEKVMAALLPEEMSDSDNDEMVEMRLQIDSHSPIKSLLTSRDGKQVVSELTMLSDFIEKFSAKMSAIGSQRAKDRKKEGRVFSKDTTDNILANTSKARTALDAIDEMINSAQPQKSNPSLIILRLKAEGKI